MKAEILIRLKGLLISSFLLIVFIVNGQVTDDFSDGDFTSNPTWSGDDTEFTIDGTNQLRLNNTSPASNNESYLSLPSTSINGTTWEFKVGFEGLSSTGLSSTNQMLIFLVADLADLEGSVNGYYVNIGNTNDEVSLYSTSSSTPIIDGEDDVTEKSSGLISVRVDRDELGNWELFIDSDGGDSYVSQGSAFNSEFTSSSFFGVLCDYTQTRATNFFFDDFFVGLTPTDMTPPTIQLVTAPSETQVDVQFSEDVDETTSQNTANYSINGISITDAARDATNNSIVHLTTSSLISGQNYTLTINNVEDLNGNTIATNSTADFQYVLIEEADFGDIVINEFLADTEGTNDDFVELYNRSDKFIDLQNWVIEDGTSTGGPTDPFSSYVLAPEAYLILYKSNSGVDYSVFGESLQIGTSAFTLNNDNDTIRLKDDSGILIVEIGYGNSPDEGISLELINPDDQCLSFASYAPSIAAEGFTPGAQNSVFDDMPDTTPPMVESFGFTSSLMINFSEPMDAISLQNGTYVPSDGLTIDQVIIIGDFPESVEITFNEEVVLGESYSLTISEVTDCSGNEIEVTTITFSFGRPPTFNELVITEILFDEDPSVGLPEREFIEIFNASEDVISTENMFLFDATGTASLPSFNLNPGSYKVLTSTSGAPEFADAVGVTSFPTLNNSGETLVLTYDNELIFSVTYDPDWHEESRSEGGYSLEMIDYTNPCVESGANWTSSISSIGGTPGSVNSVSNPQSVPDNIGPELLKVTAIAADTILLQFSEKLNSSSANAIIYDFSPELSVDSSFLLPGNTSAIYAILSVDLMPNEPYTLRVEAVTDCNGNEIRANETIFALPVQAIEGEILLSEVLFNPRTNGVDFVEVYNNSNNYITLKNWQLARIDSEGLDDQVVISDDELVLSPGDFLVLTEDPEVLFNNYPKGIFSKFLEVTPFPTYSNDTGNVVLINAFDAINEQFFYDEDFHYDLLEDVDGVSLERVSYEEPTSNADNWRSASSTEGFATPGYANSQSRDGLIASGRVTPDPKVFIPGDAARGRDFTLINYQLDEPGKFANVDIYDQSGRLVKNLANGVLLATSGFLRWDGDTEDGNVARMGYYLIIFEIYDNSGNSEIIKETVVVGRDF